MICCHGNGLNPKIDNQNISLISTVPLLVKTTGEKSLKEINQVSLSNSRSVRTMFVITLGSHLKSSRSFNTTSWLFLFFFYESRLVARQVVERQLNHNMTFRVPVQKFTSLGVKFEILVTKGSPSL